MDTILYSEVGLPIVVVSFILFFFLGTVVGSFLNVVVYRLGTGERIGNARSRCFSCGKTLQWHELIPLASFMFQRGRCWGCGSKISIQYPIVEFLSGLLFLFIAIKILPNFQFQNAILMVGTFLYFATLFSLLLAISIYDFRHKIIPNQLVYPFIILAFILGIFGSPTSDSLFSEVRLPNVIAGGGAWAFFAALWAVSKGRWMGFGDAKLALGIGFLLGPFLTLVAVVLSFWIGTLVAVPLVLLRGGGLKTQIPFGPFLAAGAFASWVFSDAIPAFSHAFLF